jgi:hypothetical protein
MRIAFASLALILFCTNIVAKPTTQPLDCPEVWANNPFTVADFTNQTSSEDWKLKRSEEKVALTCMKSYASTQEITCEYSFGSSPINVYTARLPLSADLSCKRSEHSCRFTCVEDGSISQKEIEKANAKAESKSVFSIFSSQEKTNGKKKKAGFHPSQR